METLPNNEQKYHYESTTLEDSLMDSSHSIKTLRAPGAAMYVLLIDWW